MIQFTITITQNVKGGIDYKTESPAAERVTKDEVKYATQLKGFIGEFEKWAKNENERPQIITPENGFGR